MTCHRGSRDEPTVWAPSAARVSAAQVTTHPICRFFDPASASRLGPDHSGFYARLVGKPGQARSADELSFGVVAHGEERNVPHGQDERVFGGQYLSASVMTCANAEGAPTVTGGGGRRCCYCSSIGAALAAALSPCRAPNRTINQRNTPSGPTRSVNQTKSRQPWPWPRTNLHPKTSTTTQPRVATTPTTALTGSSVR